MYTYFKYGKRELDYLRDADRRFASIIDAVGPLKRRVIPDLFAALVYCIAGQQISVKAQETVWNRILDVFGKVTPERILEQSPDSLRNTGLGRRKVEYIRKAAQKISEGQFDLNALERMTDEEVCRTLVTLDGIGVWSAEMLMLFSMQRPDIFSYGDFGIRRGLCMIYHQDFTDRQIFEKYRKKFTPCCSVASLYIWAVSGGACKEIL